MESLVRALLSTAAFLELSGDEVVDPDAAVQAFEQMSHYLQEAGPAEREVIGRVAREWASEARAKGAEGAASADFFDSFLEATGLAD